MSSIAMSCKPFSPQMPSMSGKANKPILKPIVVINNNPLVSFELFLNSTNEKTTMIELKNTHMNGNNKKFGSISRVLTMLKIIAGKVTLRISFAMFFPPSSVIIFNFFTIKPIAIIVNDKKKV